MKKSSLIQQSKPNTKVNRLWFKNRLRAGVFMKRCTGIYTDDYAFDNDVNFQKENEFTPAPVDMIDDYDLQYAHIRSNETGEIIRLSLSNSRYYEFRFKTPEELAAEAPQEAAKQPEPVNQPEPTMAACEASHELIVNKNPHYALKGRQISSSRDAHEVLKGLFNENNAQLYEQFVALFLNRKNEVIGHYLVSVGGITATIVDHRTIFTNALLLGKTTGIILSHNHPSGNIQPSDSDITLTKKISEGGKLLDIKILDHIIFNGEDLAGSYYSFANEGRI